MVFRETVRSGRRPSRTNRRHWLRILTYLSCALGFASSANAQVQMNVSTQPNSGISGVSVVNAIGSRFPDGHGSLAARDITVSLSASCGGTVIASTPAGSVTRVIGSQYRVGFTVPSTLIAGTYSVTLAGSTSDGTVFASGPGSCSELRVSRSEPRLTACLQTGSLAVNVPPAGGTVSTVTAYAPNGCWNCGKTGVQAVVIEGPEAQTAIPTPSVVNSCASNPITGRTVCVANNTDVYLINGTVVTDVLHSDSTGLADHSGGACNNCGVAINALTNQAIIEIGLAFVGPNAVHSGLQVLDLATKTFRPPVPAKNALSEGISVDPIRGLILSPNESSNYGLFTVGSDGNLREYVNQIQPFEELDSAAEDCTTGIALASSESSSSIYLADLTQLNLVPGSPGTWTAPQQVVKLNDLNFAPTGISVAQGSHLGIVTPEFVNGGRFAVIRLPDSSGTGVPTLVDYAV